MNIELSLDRDFERYLEEMTSKYGDAFLMLNGLHPSQLNFSEFIDKFVDKNTVADATIDPNANANHKDIRSFISEKGKSEDKLFGLNKIFVEMKKKWGLRTAKKWFELEFNRSFYLNDSTSASYYPYCWANDLTRLAKEGLFFLDNYNNLPPQHLSTFFDDVIEFVSFLSNRQSGAVGLPNILIWAYYFWKKDIKEGFYTKDPDTYLKQQFQKLIYRLNQPFLRIDQSAFTNVSIFDRSYLEALFGGVEFPDGTCCIDCLEEIIEFQKVFMEEVSEIREENMMTFPVITTSLHFVDGKFSDEDFARWASNHNRKWSDSNFFVSEDVGILSNCCFDGDQEFIYFDREGNKYLTTFKNFVENKIQAPYKGVQQIKSIEAESYTTVAPDGQRIPIRAVSKLPNKTKKLIEITLDDGRVLRVTPDQKIFDKNTQKLVLAEDISSNPEAYDI